MAQPKSELRLTIERDIKRALIDTWASGASTRWIDIARDMGALAEGGDAPAPAFWASVASLEASGHLGRYPGAGRCGRGSTSALHWINFSSLPITGASLRDALDPYLMDAEVQKGHKEKVNEALKQVLPPLTGWTLPRGRACSQERLLACAAALGAERICELPRRATATAGLKPHQAQEYARHLRRFVRWGAERDLIPIVFPPPRPQDAWEAFKDHYFPLRSGQGGSPAMLRKARRDCDAFREAAIRCLGPEMQDRDPDRLTPEEGAKIIDFAKRHLGWGSRAQELGGFLLHLRDEHHAGPYRSLESNPFIVRQNGSNVPRPRMYLVGPNGECPAGADWEGLRTLLALRGFPRRTLMAAPDPASQWDTFLEYYERYSTLDARTIKREDRIYPARPPRQMLSDGTQTQRILAIRLWLGAALAVRGDARSWTPVEALGTQFRHILSTLEDEWAKRAEFAADRRRRGLPAEDRVSDETSKGIERTVIAIGMLAFALYDKLALDRYVASGSVAPPTATLTRDGMRIDADAIESLPKTLREEALWAAYQRSQREALGYAAQRRERNVVTGGDNSAKQLQRMLQMMPAGNWFKIFYHLRDQVDVQRTAPDRYATTAFAALVQHTVKLGFLLSTACRESELYHLRLDTHFRGLRGIKWRVTDRKNRRMHNGVLREDILPDWLLQLWLEEARPTLMREWGTGKAAEEMWTKSPPHPFFFLNLSGEPIGCLEEDERGKGRNLKTFRDRVKNASTNFTDALARAAAALGIEIPPGHGEFGEHAIRAALGHVVFQQWGEVAAANLLGDKPEQILETYAILDAKEVDVTCLAAFRDLGQSTAASSSSTRRPSVPQQRASYLDQMATLRTQWKDGDWTDDEYEEMKAELRREYKGHDRAA